MVAVEGGELVDDDERVELAAVGAVAFQAQAGDGLEVLQDEPADLSGELAVGRLLSENTTSAPRSIAAPRSSPPPARSGSKRLPAVDSVMTARRLASPLIALTAELSSVSR